MANISMSVYLIQFPKRTIVLTSNMAVGEAQVFGRTGCQSSSSSCRVLLCSPRTLSNLDINRQFAVGNAQSITSHTYLRCSD